MRRSLPGINAELAAAVRRVNVLDASIPESRRPDICGERWHRLEAEIDNACGAGDRDAALLAIRQWEQHAARALSRALLHAPLGVADRG
ncbi:MAG: hypothetical protein H0W09_02105 [Solirubrobacterales bacterium]|nr:hypothetical protein [Solirubrobacterales bacterium]